MSTLRVNTLQNTSTTDGGISIDTSGHVTVDGVAMPSSGPLSNRNLIINGAMQVWQRGTSQTSSGSYGADRFWMSNATSAARNTDAPAGFTYSTKLTYNASDMAIGQPIELPATGQQGQLAAGTTVTLSYYAKVDSGTEAIQTSINFRDGKFDSTNQVAFTSSNANATWTTTWTRYEHQFTVPTVAGTNVLAGLEIGGISKDAYITGVQLEVGSVATPFEHRSYGDELRRCQRYYTQIGDGANPYAVLASGRLNSATAASLRLSVPVTMRAIPTATLKSATYALWEGTNNRSVGALTLYSGGGDGYEGDLATTSGTTGTFVQLRGNAASPNDPRILLSAEL